MTTSKWVPFRDTAEAILAVVGKMAAVIAPIALASFNLPAGAALVLRIIPALMGIVEQTFPAPGTGTMKKQAVLNSTQALLDYIDTQLTGGAKSSFTKLKPLIDGIIDNGIGLVNQLAPSIIADDEVPPGPPVVGSGINAPISSP